VKIAGVYEAPWHVRVGTAVRYQDGQHFARFVIPTGLNQGPEPIKGIYNGDSRLLLRPHHRRARREGVRRRPQSPVRGVRSLQPAPGTGIEVEERTWSGARTTVTRPAVAAAARHPPRLRYDF
jgi:hypothetical protein